MRILGIDTSCDDTAISLVEVKDSKFLVLSNVISSQVKIHAQYGGVWPFLAKREHQKNLPIVFKKATKGIEFPKIDLISVTIGPGLEPCLWQGINFAKDLAQKLKKPLIPINHIEAHIIANFIGENSKFEILNSKQIQNSKFKIQNIFPAVCLVVSGGHTQLILMKGIGNYKLIGETRDDAAGECFDKVARILGLAYPGGPLIAQEAEKYTGPTRAILPRPMIYQKNYDFSFAGLKTAVLYNYKNQSEKFKKSKEYIRAMAKEVQQAIIDVLIKKTLRAAKDFKVKSIILGGGVAANEELRRQFKERIEKELPNNKYLIPDIKYCTDNAAMVAATAYFHQNKATKNWPEIKANANLRI